jgi:hypothetical protein
MTKMEICSEVEDLQASKLNEFILVVHRVRKVGHGVRLGLNKNKLRPNRGYGDAQASTSTSSENQLQPTTLLIRHCQNFAKLLPSRPPPPTWGTRLARREGSRIKDRRIRPLPRIGRDSSKQARQRKRFCLGVMADHAESFSNDHLRQPPLWTSR